MIVSDSHKFIFIHVPKTAGSSMTRALKPYADGWPWRLRKHNHETLSEFLVRYERSRMKQLVFGRRNFASYYTFGFTRNPWDKMVSWFAYLRRSFQQRIPEVAGIEDFNDFVAAIERKEPWVMKLHGVRPQTDFLRRPSGRIEVDFLGSFENLQADIARLCEELGITIDMPHRNASSHGSYTDYYNESSKSFIATNYAEDIETFGYTFGR